MNKNHFQRRLGKSALKIPPLGLGTWAIGGLHWGGTDETDSLNAIHAAIDHGITLIDTAPIYGFGLSEEIVGRALKESSKRKQVILATKCGLEWSTDHRQVRRNASPERIRTELDLSLQRLQTDVIDLYQIHWHDQNTPIAESLTTLEILKQSGKIRAYGVSNFSKAQLQECLELGTAQLASNQPPYNLFERAAEHDILPFCQNNELGVLAYGGLCRGLLSGKVGKSTEYPQGDLRRADPKFKADKRSQYLKAVTRFEKIAQRKDCSVAQLAIAWVFQQPGVTCSLVGARNAEQAQHNAQALAIEFNETDFAEIDRALKIEIKTPVGPEFFAPPL